MKYKLLTIIVILIIAILILNLPKNETNDQNNIKSFQEDFESVSNINQIISIDLWHGTQISENNLVEISQEKARSGSNSLKLFALPYNGEVASKADIQKELLNFKQGDDFWFSGWFYIEDTESAKNLFLFDIESTETPTYLFLKKSPGRRLYLGDSNEIKSDMGKWYNKNVVRQEYGKEISLPQNNWVNIKLHLYLSADNSGLIEVWQDNIKVLNKNTQTLPTKNSVYNRMQVGITANGNEEYSQTLYLDDLEISDKPI